MKKILSVLGIIVYCLILSAFCQAYAEDEEATGTSIKQELAADRQQLREQHQEMLQNSQEARAEEKQLREQIQQAEASGDLETARQLRELIRAMHRENVREMQQDTQDFGEARQELKEDIKEARKDNNPPGPVGGPGTNWGNPPGPKGGPGASPNRGRR